MELVGPILAWWLALSVIGWATVPLAWRLFATLPDRGLAFARPLGLLLVGYGWWLAVMAGVLPNSTVGAVFLVLLLTALGVWLGWRDQSLVSFLKNRRRLVWTYEALFLVTLAGWAVYRAHYPNIETAGGEKYMEMAFIDGVLASERFPPLDPWLSGFAISYYYFGYVLAGLLIRLTRIVPYVAFNLVIPGTMAMCIVAALGLGYNLAGLARASWRARYAGGALTAILLVVVGNLEGALELAYIRGWGTARFWNFLDIKNLTLGQGSCPGEATMGFGAGGWVPQRFIWWWRGSRVIHDKCGEVIHEFPFFSFMLADVHPHVLALPAALVVLGLALAVLSGSLETLGRRRYWSASWLVLPLVVGSLGFLNAWDLPTYALVLVISFALRATTWPEVEQVDWTPFAIGGLGLGWLGWRLAPALVDRLVPGVSPGARAMWAGGLVLLLVLCVFALGRLWWRRAQGGDLASRRVMEVTRFAVWLLVLAVVLYLPFYVGFSSQVSGIGVVTVRSRLSQWLVHFGLLFFLAMSLAAARLGVIWRRRGSLSWPSLAVLGLALPVAAISLGWQAWTALLVTVVAGAAALAGIEGWAEALAGHLRPNKATWEGAGGAQVAVTFALLCVALGLVLPLGTEFLFVRDLFGTRMNSVFKLYFQAWTLLAVGGAYGSYVVWCRLGRWGRGLWLVPTSLLLAASLVYPAMATYTRTRRPPETPLSLNGLRWWETVHPDDLAAVEWLKANAQDAPVILEAPGGGYEHNGRISMATGFPAVLGWRLHENQWRGPFEEIDRREQDVERMYTTASREELRELLERYGVRYVIVGATERGRYGLSEAAVERFGRWLKPVFQSGQLKIFDTS